MGRKEEVEYIVLEYNQAIKNHFEGLRRVSRNNKKRNWFQRFFDIGWDNEPPPELPEELDPFIKKEARKYGFKIAKFIKR